MIDEIIFSACHSTAKKNEHTASDKASRSSAGSLPVIVRVTWVQSQTSRRAHSRRYTQNLNAHQLLNCPKVLPIRIIFSFVYF